MTGGKRAKFGTTDVEKTDCGVTAGKWENG